MSKRIIKITENQLETILGGLMTEQYDDPNIMFHHAGKILTGIENAINSIGLRMEEIENFYLQPNQSHNRHGVMILIGAFYEQLDMVIEFFETRTGELMDKEIQEVISNFLKIVKRSSKRLKIISRKDSPIHFRGLPRATQQGVGMEMDMESLNNIFLDEVGKVGSAAVYLKEKISNLSNKYITWLRRSGM
jgi:hypothetical protein